MGSFPSKSPQNQSQNTQEELKKTTEERIKDLIQELDLIQKEEIPAEFCCNILFTLMSNPVKIESSTSTAHYDEENILAWFQQRDSDPATNNPLTNLSLTYNAELKEQISTYITARIEKYLEIAYEFISLKQEDLFPQIISNIRELSSKSSLEEQSKIEDKISELYEVLLDRRFANFEELMLGNPVAATNLYYESKKEAASLEIKGDLGNIFIEVASHFKSYHQEQFSQTLEKFNQFIEEKNFTAALEILNKKSLQKISQEIFAWAEKSNSTDTATRRNSQILHCYQVMVSNYFDNFKRLLLEDKNIEAAREVHDEIKKLAASWRVGNFEDQFAAFELQIQTYYKEEFSERIKAFNEALKIDIFEARLFLDHLKTEAKSNGLQNIDQIFLGQEEGLRKAYTKKIKLTLAEFDEAIERLDIPFAERLMNDAKRMIQIFDPSSYHRNEDITSRSITLETYKDPKKMAFEAVGSGDIKLLQLCLAINPELAKISPRDETNPYWGKSQPKPHGNDIETSYLMSSDIEDNNTLLHCAAKRNQIHLCGLLIAFGALSEKKNDNNKTPKELAEYHLHKTLFKRVEQGDTEMITAKLKEEVETMRKEILSKTLSIEELKINEPSSRPSTPSLQELSNEEQKKSSSQEVQS